MRPDAPGDNAKIPLLRIKFHPTASSQVSSDVLLGAETGLCHLSLQYTETIPASSWLLSLRCCQGHLALRSGVRGDATHTGAGLSDESLPPGTESQATVPSWRL